MKIVMNEVCDEIIINKSRFITIIFPLYDLSSFSDKLIAVKNKYKDATHYCFAYIINSMEKCSDDGEPSGTAGLPILNVLKNNNLTNVLCIVVRYFGGIKLGAGGLVRAYSSSVSNALTNCKFGVLEDGYKVTIEFDYDNIKNVDHILRDLEIQKDFKEKVIYTFKVLESNYLNIKCQLLKFSDVVSEEKISIIKGD